ncbi:MAG TPA: saccharopine dehydrogenase C-terminal domain-containing protein [Candidatus Deferrimicrobium sp.]|nr:saccharopine dehydrogenase C-terminal domain-containing protein [Candidatus Deferrimicrobium sp.]
MNFAVIGAGLMGRAVVYDLARNPAVHRVGVFDIDETLAFEIAGSYGMGKARWGALDAADVDAAVRTLREYDAAVSCVGYQYNPGLTRAAIAAHCHLADLGGNNDVVRTQLVMDAEAQKSDVIVVPDCGLAPGMVSILAADGIFRFDHVRSLKIRVGGLPQFPRPPLNYQLVFSAEGLLNEYWEPCLILEQGQKKIVDPMTDVEQLNFDGVGELEAFYTSGGVSTLPDTYAGMIDFIDYKTIRYPGHCALFRPMLELGLASRQPLKIDGQMIEPRALFRAVLERSLTFGEPDMVVVRLTLVGDRNGREEQLRYEILDRFDAQTGLTAMMRMTAFPAAIVAAMAAGGQISARGCKPQELVINPTIFISELEKRGIRMMIHADTQ